MKIALFFALFLLIGLQLENVFATDLLIKTFSIESEYSDYLHYHLAKIVPAGPYQVIIWDQQVGHHDLLGASSSTSSNRFCDGREIFHVPRQRGAADQRQFVFLADAIRNDGDANANLNDAALAKCFVHFHTVKTDRKGRFLLRSDGKLADRSSMFNQQYNVHLIALNDNSQPIVDDVSYPLSTKAVAQRVYVNDMRNPVDKICQHIDDRCVINFYPTGLDREKQMKEMTKRWLTDQQHYQEMSEMVNFFLIAVFHELITSAKEKSALNVGTLTSNEAQLIGHFWNKFASTKKNGLLHKRLRLIDHQMVRLIDDFCKIDASFLRSHHELNNALSASNQPEKFCENWPKVKETANKYTNLEIVMESFGHWLHTSEQLNNDEENFIYFWIEVFSKRLQSRCYNWPFLDQNLFQQIGMMFVTVKDEHKLTLDKICRGRNSFVQEVIFRQSLRMILEINENCQMKKKIKLIQTLKMNKKYVLYVKKKSVIMLPCRRVATRFCVKRTAVAPPPVASIEELENELLVPADVNWGQQLLEDQLSADANKNEADSYAVEEMSILENELNNNHDKFTSIVFGHFATLSCPFMPAGSMTPRQKRFAKTLLFGISSILFTVRAIWYIKLLGTSPNLSLEWAHNSLQLSISLNALGILYWFRTGGADYFNDFCTILSKTIGQNGVPTISTSSKICAYILAFICMFTCSIWAFRQVLQIEMNKNVHANSNGSYVEQHLSEMELISKEFIIFFDALAAIYAGFICSIALCLFYLSFQSVLAEWVAFQSIQFKDAIETGRISDSNFLTELCNTICPLLRFAHFTSNKLEQLGMNIFMTAVFCSISASFISSGGGGGPKNEPINWHLFNVVNSINNGAWGIFSLILLINVIKGPYDVHSKIREIREELILTDSIWNSNGTKLISLTKTIITRISGTRIHRIGSQLFNLIFVAQVVFVYLLVSGSKCGQQPHK
ncbi:hypothetical protein niasHS_013759 [Heterodera schachtii]|uniref:Uncharacterized protein n=1 Tax=Heterodera schachtii TaxID=97005 RepID=A0ABD2ITE1_HETSC